MVCSVVDLKSGLEELNNVIDKAMKIEILDCKTKKGKDYSTGLFSVKTANRWIEEAKNRPIPKMLFGEFWFEGELCILFSDTNLGKSILAVQIGNSISKSEQIDGFLLESPQQPILYFDFELSDKQFENRYSINYEEHYNFDNNFIRVEIDADAVIPENKDFESHLCDSLELAILKSNSKILIIDNLTFLKTDTEKAKDALSLMKQLKLLKNKYDLSILVLAHTPKRDLSKAITKNDLAGSKMLINFCDSSFTIGGCYTDKNIRYIKQIKQRNTEEVYGSENVCVCQIDKPTNFLQFEFLKFGNEKEHLKQLLEKDRESIIQNVKELSAQGKTQRDISAELGISLGGVNKYLKL
jgi:RecA-family ATPase